MTNIVYPGKHDVMLGRGGESNYHAGNLSFRSFIKDHKKRYQEARKQDKPIIALEIVLAWREQDPPGRFLARVDPSRADSLWYDVGDDAACKRAGRTLGEKSAPMTKQDGTAVGEEDSTETTGSMTSSTSLERTIRKKTSKKRKIEATPSTTTSGTMPSQPRWADNRSTLDFIASFTSTNVLHDHDDNQYEVEAPRSTPTKRQKTMWGEDSPTMTVASPPADRGYYYEDDQPLPAGVVGGQGQQQVEKKPSPIVSPDGTPKHISTRAAAMLVDNLPRLDHHGAFLGDRHQERNYASFIPTAEFLTRTVFMD